MAACKLEYWWKWEVDPLEVSKKYFSNVDGALAYADEYLLHHKDWRIIKDGIVIATYMGRILCKAVNA
jgi:hypothetical protein